MWSSKKSFLTLLFQMTYISIISRHNVHFIMRISTVEGRSFQARMINLAYLVLSGVRASWVQTRSISLHLLLLHGSLFLSIMHHIPIHGISVDFLYNNLAANNTIMQWVIWPIDQQWKRVVVSSQCRLSGNRQWTSVLGGDNETGGR